MPPGSIARLPEILVRYVAGDRNQPIPEQAPVAIERLETEIASLRGQKFYCVVVDGEYRACIAVDEDDALTHLPEFHIPGGRYYCQRITGFLEQPARIGALVSRLVSRNDYDAARYVVEFYRGHDEVSVRVPVN